MTNSLVDNSLILIKIAREFGLEEKYLNHAMEFVENHEYGLCFDIIVTQLYEDGIKIDNESYLLISELANKMNMPSSSYNFMRQLVKPANS